ncbi:MAG: 2-oxo acid dehydrogenase subunit E2 [Alphaproteobacteria bacterium]|nr:2-oxo acid dehydrogenase subunit E2 [Alphaproteobacteria bacterium]
MTMFNLPDLGEGLQEAEIIAWHVSEGDHVVADQPLVSVETEKAVVEVPAPTSGRLLRQLAKVGEHLKVGAALAEFDDGARSDAGAIVGDLTTPSAPATVVPSASSPAAPPLAPQSEAAPTPAGTASVRAAPAVRARAKALGIELATIPGSGPDGTITLADLEAARPAATAGAPLRGMRRAMALKMGRFAAEVAPATVTEEADIGAWPAAEPDVTARLMRALAAGARAEPALNAWYDGRALRVERRARIDIGLAVDTEDGLVVPVLRDAGGLDTAALRARIDSLKQAARERRLAPADLAGPTLTLSNFGMIAGLTAALAIAPPQVAIVGAGRLHRRVDLVGDTVVARRVLPLSLTFDHRAVTGGEAARFLRAVVADLEKPD